MSPQDFESGIERIKVLRVIGRLSVGWRGDLPRIFADLDVLVVSSDEEETPVSAMENMASGRPVMATCVGGLPDLITDAGVTVL